MRKPRAVVVWCIEEGGQSLDTLKFTFEQLRAKSNFSDSAKHDVAFFTSFASVSLLPNAARMLLPAARDGGLLLFAHYAQIKHWHCASTGATLIIILPLLDD